MPAAYLPFLTSLRDFFCPLMSIGLRAVTSLRSVLSGEHRSPSGGRRADENLRTFDNKRFSGGRRENDGKMFLCHPEPSVGECEGSTGYLQAAAGGAMPHWHSGEDRQSAHNQSAQRECSRQFAGNEGCKAVLRRGWLRTAHASREILRRLSISHYPLRRHAPDRCQKPLNYNNFRRFDVKIDGGHENCAYLYTVNAPKTKIQLQKYQDYEKIPPFCRCGGTRNADDRRLR